MTSTITGADVVRGGLKDMKLAIFPYNPNMKLEEVLEVIRFVKEGGKILVFYCCPSASTICSDSEERVGSLRTSRSSIVRSASTPLRSRACPQVAQASWNIILVEPVRDKAR